MRTVLRIRPALAAGAVVALLVVSGCGRDSDDPAAGDAAGPSASSSASSAGESPSASTSVEPSPSADAGDGGSWDRDTLMTAMQQAMEEQDTAHLTMTTEAAGATLEVEGDVDYGSPEQDMQLVMSGQAFGADSMELRRVGGVMYLSMPPVTPEGKFIAMGSGDAGAGGMLTDMPGVDPRDTFDAFDAGLEDVVFVGTETVDGEELEHYRLTVDAREAAKAQGLPRSAGLPASVDYDMWVDEDALMRRVELDMERRVSMVMELSNWGEPVEISAPARRDIVEAPGH